MSLLVILPFIVKKLSNFWIVALSVFQFCVMAFSDCLIISVIAS